MPTPENQALYQRLLALAKATPDVVFVGRLANYKYFNMDEAIANALDVFRAEVCSPIADVHVVVTYVGEDLGWMRTLCDEVLAGRSVRWFLLNKGTGTPGNDPHRMLLLFWPVCGVPSHAGANAHAARRLHRRGAHASAGENQ